MMRSSTRRRQPRIIRRGCGRRTSVAGFVFEDHRQYQPVFSQRNTLHPNTKALVWSGDNPCSVIGLGLIKEGMVGISLGTSDTYFGSMKRCQVDERGEGHVFSSPTGDYMTLICFKNGSLARERIRDTYKLDWNGFNKALADTPPGSNGAIMLPWFRT